MVCPECAKRLVIIATDRQGGQSTIHRCANSVCEKVGQVVSAEDCTACEVAAIPPKRADLSSLKRSRLFPPCELRIERRKCRPCGRPLYPPQFDRVCICADSKQNSKKVFPQVCHDCPVRREPPSQATADPSS